MTIFEECGILVHMKDSRLQTVWDKLDEEYPHAHCELDYGTPFELLVAVILSAQCTDKRVNEVTKTLFKRANTPKDFVEMPIEELESLIRSCGFFRNKAKNIKSMSLDVLTRYGGEVPHDFDERVGRKTANVVSSVAFGGDGIAVDTHVYRLAHRLGLSNGKTPYDVEKDLTELIDAGQRARVHHLLIFHGRYCCKAQRPECARCPISGYCAEFAGTGKAEVRS